MNQNRDYTDHCWLDDDKLIVGTESGEIFFVDNFELKQPIENAFNTGGFKQGPIGEDGKQQPPLSVSLIKAFSKGFYISSNNGWMALWVRSEENNSTSGKQAFDFIRKWQPKGTKDLDILSLDVSPNEEYLSISL
jgi:hypothetical protein